MFSNICFVTLEPKVSLKKTFLYNKGAVITYRMEEKTSRYFGALTLPRKGSIKRVQTYLIPCIALKL